MTTTHPLAKYTAVPRYTSYPTAPHFYSLPPDTRSAWLATMNDAPVSIYLHIPYCAQQCWFCGCHTRITRRYEPVRRYLETLYDEIRLVAQAIGRRQRVGHVHLGGGSPSMLSPEDFTCLMSHLTEYFSLTPQAEIAIELDPRGANEAKIAAYALAGVNRISLGLQDFSIEVQAAIHRHQPFHTVYETVALARAYGMQNISFDLVYGLPKQTLDGFEASLRLALTLRPSRVALFGYAHVPWVKKAMRLIDASSLPDAELRCAMAARAATILADHGYEAVGLDHYALPGDALAEAARNSTLRRNFQGYTTDRCDALIGLGASSISQLLEGYVQNPPRIETYAEQVALGQVPQAKGFALTAEDRFRRGAIEQLMCGLALDLGEYSIGQGYAVDALDGALPALRKLEADGLVRVDGRYVAVEPDYPQAVRLVCAAFDSYLNPHAQIHSQVA